MAYTWLVVADGSRARLFALDRTNGKLDELTGLANPAGRAHERDLVTDQPGRSFQSADDTRHAMDVEVTAKEQEVRAFAKDLAAHLETARAGGEFRRLIIAAAPEFLGLLRKRLTPATAEVVREEIAKDLTKHAAKDIYALVVD